MLKLPPLAGYGTALLRGSEGMNRAQKQKDMLSPLLGCLATTAALFLSLCFVPSPPPPPAGPSLQSQLRASIAQLLLNTLALDHTRLMSNAPCPCPLLSVQTRKEELSTG